MSNDELFAMRKKQKQSQADQRYKKPMRVNRDRYFSLLQEIDRLKQENGELKNKLGMKLKELF
jgi:hypothetical protein